MAESEIKLHTPGEDESLPPAPAPAAKRASRAAAAPAPASEVDMPAGDPQEVADPEIAAAGDDQAAYVAKLEADNAQLTAMVVMLQEQIANVQEPNEAPVAREPRLIGDDWSNRTSAEAREAGVRKTVLCSDGYYVPQPVA